MEETEYEDTGDNYKKPIREYSNDVIEIRLYCSHKDCNRYILGYEGYNGSFTSKDTHREADLRNQRFICSKHLSLDEE